ncbi:MAG: hypothetical protein DRN30_04575 [Thermoplasmata archaeon]|nr:MAG: hypothetical protein DRN30_04575 [Thermoplasmata archaeon]
MTQLDFRVNLREIAEKVGQTAEALSKRVNDEIKNLSISTHAFVVSYANEKLKGFNRSHFFGEGGQNVRWNEVAPNIWVVEIDESVKWIEEGRGPVSMATADWLLKPGAKGVKTAKDGSTYRVIPFSHGQGVGGKKTSGDPEIASMIRKTLRKKSISLNKIERDQFDKPKLGVLHKLGINEKRSQYPQSLFSAPRNEKTAKQIGLKAHTGHHYLNNAVVVQRETEGKNGKSKISKEVVTFRVVSSKHQAEGKWMSPKVEPLNSIPEAYKYAEGEWEKIVKSMEDEYRRT